MKFTTFLLPIHKLPLLDILKAVSELGLHYFLRRINATVRVKELSSCLLGYKMATFKHLPHHFEQYSFCVTKIALISIAMKP